VKLYISGPMTGLPEFNYPLFRDVAKFFRNEGITILSQAEIDGGEQVGGNAEVKTWDYYMRHALRLELEADAIAFLPGWTTSKGARREFDIACDLKFLIFTVVETLGGYRLDELA
jgi:hypothetical protein